MDLNLQDSIFKIFIHIIIFIMWLEKRHMIFLVMSINLDQYLQTQGIKMILSS